MGAKVYDSNQVAIIFGGINIDSGRENGDFIKITPVSDDYLFTAGADGEVGISKSNDNQYDIEITLMHSSASNFALSTLKNVQDLAPAGNLLPLLVKDSNGSEIFASGKCLITVNPEITHGKEMPTRTWKLRATSGTFVGGGISAS